jgi:NAD(P)-dependent dehydrogenase (short-subunit alcohol dehydrogenase family)
VNSLHPGQIDTDMHTHQRERTPELIERLVAQIPMGRIGDPQEVAQAAVFLATDESRYVTEADRDRRWRQRVSERSCSPY